MSRYIDAATKAVEDNKDSYTKEELTIYKNGMKGLAYHVVKQWVRDGAPSKDLAGIRPWLALLMDTALDNDKDSNETYKIGE